MRSFRALFLVLQQRRFDEYRAIQSVQDKAQVAGNGHSLVKTCNAVLNALVCSLRASEKAVIYVVAAFMKGATIPRKRRLVANRFLTRCTHQTYVAGVLVLLLLGGQAFAATLSERTYKRLTAIHELMGESKYKEAVKRLDALLPRVRKHKYEYATIMQTYGFAYAAQEKYKQAIKAFNQALNTEALPDRVQLSMRYNLAQLYAAVPDWKASARAYEKWLAATEKPSADSYAFGATIYAQMKQYDKAIPKIRKAISLADKPRENWYQLLLSMLYQKKSYGEAAKVLERMVAFWPDKKQYWKQLSGVYFTLKKSRKSLAVLVLAHKQGFLEKERELMNLVNMYLLQNIPYKAARLMEKEMQAGRVKRTGKNLQKLGEAWMRAKETDEALRDLQAAADAQSKGVLYLRLAQLHTDKENWNKVIDLANKAMAAGGLKNPGDAYLLKGMAQFETGKKQSAMATFSKALKYSKSKRQANQWIKHIRTEGA